MKDEYRIGTRELLVHINKHESISIVRQTELLGIPRSSVYYMPQSIDDFTLGLMNCIDDIYTKRPYYGSRRIAKEMSNILAMPINRKRIQRLMQIMGIEAIYPKPNLSLNTMSHPIYPYLLRGIPACHPNHIWGTDITYIRMQQGFLYLVAFMDWYSRYVVSWRLSNTLTGDFVIEAAEEALSMATPSITNSDQGVQFTSQNYLSLWDRNKTKISMDGRGRCMDNIFTERLWRSLKYEEVYLKNYTTVLEAKQGIDSYLQDYNNYRLHSALDYKTPAEIYFRKEVKIIS